MINVGDGLILFSILGIIGNVLPQDTAIQTTNSLLEYGLAGIFIVILLGCIAVLWKALNNERDSIKTIHESYAQILKEKEDSHTNIIREKDRELASLNDESKDFATKAIEAMTLATKAMENLDGTRNVLIKEFNELRREVTERFNNICGYDRKK